MKKNIEKKKPSGVTEKILKFMRLDLYDRIAVFEPAVVNLVFISSAVFAMGTGGFQQMPSYSILKWILMTTSSIAIFAILARFLMNLFRSVSKVLVQNIIYDGHQLRMPTTEYLLLTSKLGDRNTKLSVRRKVKKDFGIDLPTKEEELADEVESRNYIVITVGRIRDYLRTKVAFKNLKMYNKKNRRYGYVRNFLGGFLFMTPIYIMLIIYCLLYTRDAFLWVIGIFVLHLLFFGCYFLTLKNEAEDYAKEFFITYLNN